MIQTIPWPPITDVSDVIKGGEFVLPNLLDQVSPNPADWSQLPPGYELLRPSPAVARRKQYEIIGKHGQRWNHKPKSGDGTQKRKYTVRMSVSELYRITKARSVDLRPREMWTRTGKESASEFGGMVGQMRSENF